MKRVLSVGNCGYDDRQIAAALKSWFEVEIVSCGTADEAIGRLATERFDLVLVNRILEDRGTGCELIAQMKEDRRLRDVPVMLVSNRAEAQAEAQSLGAAEGFGKRDLQSEQTKNRLQPFLGQ